LNNLAICLTKLKRFEEAIEVQIKAAAKQPNVFLVNYNLAVAYQSAQKYPEAIASYDHALKIEPDNSEALYNLAFCLQQTGDKKDKKRSGEIWEHYLKVAPPGAPGTTDESASKGQK